MITDKRRGGALNSKYMNSVTDSIIGFLDFRLEYKSGILISDRNYFPLKSEWRYTMINQKLLPLNLSILDES